MSPALKIDGGSLATKEYVESSLLWSPTTASQLLELSDWKLTCYHSRRFRVFMPGLSTSHRLSEVFVRHILHRRDRRFGGQCCLCQPTQWCCVCHFVEDAGVPTGFLSPPALRAASLQTPSIDLLEMALGERGSQHDTYLRQWLLNPAALEDVCWSKRLATFGCGVFWSSAIHALAEADCVDASSVSTTVQPFLFDRGLIKDMWSATGSAMLTPVRCQYTVDALPDMLPQGLLALVRSQPSLLVRSCCRPALLGSTGGTQRCRAVLRVVLDGTCSLVKGGMLQQELPRDAAQKVLRTVISYTKRSHTNSPGSQTHVIHIEVTYVRLFPCSAPPVPFSVSQQSVGHSTKHQFSAITE